MIVYDYRLNMMIEHDVIDKIDTLSTTYNKNRSKIVRKLLVLGLKMEREMKNLFEKAKENGILKTKYKNINGYDLYGNLKSLENTGLTQTKELINYIKPNKK